MSGLMDKAKSAAGGGGSDNKSAEGGNNIERSADKTANDQINNSGVVPEGAKDTVNKAADSKINEQIPGGN